MLNYETGTIDYLETDVLYNDNKYSPEIKKVELSEFFDFIVNELKIQ